MEFNLCDDPHYGYIENLLSVCGSFDEAKAMLDAHILECYGEEEQEDHSSFSQIIRMQMGNSVKEILYDTSVPIKKNELCTPVDTGSDDEGDEFLDAEHKELWRMECERMEEIERRWFEVDLAEHNRREAKKVLVYFFEMRIPFSHPKIETIFHEFGQNIPEYLQYEGGSRDEMTVVCCVDSSINAKIICLQNCVSYTKLSELEIDEMMYRNSNRVSCGYGGYRLEPIP